MLEARRIGVNFMVIPAERGMALELIVRLKAAWFQKLLACARPETPAKRCLMNCVYEPVDGSDENEYTMRADERALGMVAALADEVCPQAVPRLSIAYRTARSRLRASSDGTDE
jgi:hypothetical protein